MGGKTINFTFQGKTSMLNKEVTKEICDILRCYVEEIGKEEVKIFFPDKFKDIKWNGGVELTFINSNYVTIHGSYGQNYARQICD